LFSALGLFLGWRATLGFDFRDGSYVTALAMRVARGELPFRDESSLHVLGSLPAVPFVWLWTHVVGVHGLVLASRIFFVACALGAGLLAYSALSPIIGCWPTAVGVATALLVVPYNLLVTSYSTVPALCTLVGTASCVRCLWDGSARWAMVTGLSWALATVAFPIFVVPAAVVVAGTWILLPAASGPRSRKGARRTLAFAWSAPLLMAAVGAVLIMGWTPTMDAVHNAASQRGVTVNPTGYLVIKVHDMLQVLVGSKLLPLAALLAMVACLPLIRAKLRGLLVLCCPLLVLVWSAKVGQSDVTEPTAGRYSGFVAWWLLILLTPPVTVWAWRRLGRRMRAAALLAGVVGLVGTVGFATVSASGAQHGAFSAGFVGVLAIVAAGATAMVTHSGLPLSASISLALLTPMVASLLLVVFNEGPFMGLSQRIDSGAAQGLLVGNAVARDVQSASIGLSTCARMDEGLIVIRQPGISVLTNAPTSAETLWTLDDGEREAARMDARGKYPGCLVVAVDSLRPTAADLVSILQGYDAVGTVTLSPSVYHDVPNRFLVYQRRP